MKLKIVTVTTKYSSTQEGAISQQGGGGENKDDAMESNSCGSSSNGSAAKVRGRCFHGQFSSNGTEIVFPRKVVGRRHRDEERELVDRPLS